MRKHDVVGRAEAVAAFSESSYDHVCGLVRETDQGVWLTDVSGMKPETLDDWESGFHWLKKHFPEAMICRIHILEEFSEFQKRKAYENQTT